MNDFIPKTDSTVKPVSVNGEVKKKSSHSKATGAFDQILTQTMQEAGQTQKTSGSSGLPEIQSPVKTPFTAPGVDAFSIRKKLESSLNLFETYAAFLADPDKTLKQASDLLDKILNQGQELEQTFNESSGTDAELKKILTHLTTTAAIERIKMDRGDYLA